MARDINAIAILAPGVVRGDPDLGGGSLPSFAGASVAENGYYINGFDVTNIRNFLSYSNLPFEAIGAQQVKSGGYGAEYGRSLGGVISIVTKRAAPTPGRAALRSISRRSRCRPAARTCSISIPTTPSTRSSASTTSRRT